MEVKVTDSIKTVPSIVETIYPTCKVRLTVGYWSESICRMKLPSIFTVRSQSRLLGEQSVSPQPLKYALHVRVLLGAGSLICALPSLIAFESY